METDWEARESKNFSKAKFGIYQNIETLPDPLIVKPVGEKGQFLNTKTIQELDLAMYWQSKQKQIALLCMIPASILTMILVNESDIFNILFNSVIGFFGSLIGVFL